MCSHPFQVTFVCLVDLGHRHLLPMLSTLHDLASVDRGDWLVPLAVAPLIDGVLVHHDLLSLHGVDVET